MFLVHQIIYRKYIETKQVADDDWGDKVIIQC